MRVGGLVPNPHLSYGGGDNEEKMPCPACPLPPAALEKAGHAPLLGSTMELILSPVTLPVGPENVSMGDLALPLICHMGV